jgi:crotonobetainyl-CoA:carnitine CoA-transferase CaiB-like acyl-CoA transferase
MAAGALQGIRVIDFGQYLAGPLAAMLLADHGADVIRVDPPGGPRWRHPCNAVLQRGKRSIVLDLKGPSDLDVARRLVAAADVLIEGFRPGVMARLGLGAESAPPHLIYCSLPGFAQDDPRAAMAGWEGVVSAAAGLYARGRFNPTQDPNGGPIYTPVPLASSYAAFIAAHAIVAALIARHRAGFGQHVEVALFDAAHQVIGESGSMVNGELVPRLPLTRNRAVLRRHRCADGRYVDISPPLRGWPWLAERYLPRDLIERGVTDLQNPDPAAQTELLEVLGRLFSTRGGADWERVVNEEVGTGMALCQSVDEWLRDEHARASRCTLELADPELGPTLMAGYPISLSRTPPHAQGPRHRVDADRDAILGELNGAPSVASEASPEPGLRQALAGFRVIDTSQILAGPTAARVLAEYGADVIKINNPRCENAQAAMAHTYVNNGKRSALLDLKSPHGLDILWRLLEHTDVFHQNFRPGVPERLGIDEAALRRRRPDLIYSSVSTHAEGGFRSLWRGHEELGQAVTGLQVRAGGDGEPLRAAWPVCDYGTGHLSAFAIVLALYHRLRTGEAQHVRASLSGTGTYLQIPFMLDYPGHARHEPRGEQATGWGPLYRLYRARDAWFFLAAPDHAALAAVEGLEGVDVAELETRVADQPAATWVERLRRAGVSAHVHRAVAENMLDPVAQARGLSVVRQHEGVGSVRNVGRSGRLSRTPLDPLIPAQPLGWHTREIVEEVGLAESVAQLVASGAVGLPGEAVPV